MANPAGQYLRWIDWEDRYHRLNLVTERSETELEFLRKENKELKEKVEQLSSAIVDYLNNKRH